MQFNQIEQKVQNAQELDFGSIINSVIDLYKKIWLKGFLIILILMIFGFVINYLFGLIGLTTEPFLFDREFNIDLLSSLSMNSIYSLPQTILISSLSIALLAAFYRMCKQIDLGEIENDDYFYFFKKEYINKVFVLGFIYTLIATVAQMLFVIPYIYVFVPLSYFPIIFANNPNLSEMEIVKSSFSLGNKKWLITFGTLFLSGIMGMLGIIACGIGLLFTISIVYLPVYFIYKHVIGFDENSEIDEIGKE